MLAFLRAQRMISDRMLQHFACGCCRRVWHRLFDPRSRAAVETTERYIDGLATPDDLAAALRAAEAAQLAANALRHRDAGEYAAVATASALQWQPGRWPCPESVADQAARAAADLAESTGGNRKARRDLSIRASLAERASQCDLLRDIVGNPFRPAPPVDPQWLAWRNGTVRRLAEAVYQEQAFDRLAILADALEEAGCGATELLIHCRQPGAVHIRGCWVVDLVLGKT
jgi:hypothetical protein